MSLALAPLASGQAQAQDKKGKSEESKPAAEETVKPTNAAYMKPLGRLATILGSMHFLRGLCGDADADVWRAKMDAILAAQAPNEADRRILVASFNQGYRAFASTYRMCTPAATVAMERYRQEGANLSREISARYGN
ncbi:MULTISPECIES: TIGR02301 family protein [unclassified Aureimonas]|uniref:TIGR02301 family protein n=1 Tax=unclassified Aureimonas TaxID=2615206 RepID=UPI0016510048|nr:MULTISPECIES: TIGR02301 family protein [unclassified Aureimonas]